MAAVKLQPPPTVMMDRPTTISKHLKSKIFIVMVHAFGPLNVLGVEMRIIE
jgi:hypothetical protein